MKIVDESDKLEYKDFFPDLTKPIVSDDSKFDASELTKGTDEEHEHTDDDVLAAKIAKDHLSDDPEYYSNMEKCNALKDAGKLSSLLPTIQSDSKNIIKASDKPASGPHITGDINGTPLNTTITSGTTIFGEGGSKITEPNAGITSDMGKKRWTIDAYPQNKKITPTL
jgi:hypothetical protein